MTIGLKKSALALVASAIFVVPSTASTTHDEPQVQIQRGSLPTDEAAWLLQAIAEAPASVVTIQTAAYRKALGRPRHTTPKRVSWKPVRRMRSSVKTSHKTGTPWASQLRKIKHTIK